MKIATVEISGFRAFSGNTRFDLDGDVVLVVGANGQGKTSLFDAILWAFTGEISRLNRPDAAVSLFSDTGEARVEVTGTSDDGRKIVVTRHSDGVYTNLLLQTDDEVFRGQDAEQELLRSLWPDGLTAHNPREALCSALERGVYLQQDVLTAFLTADTDQERFNAIGELIGTGRATELQEALERARSTWSRGTNRRIAEAEEVEERLTRLKAQRQELLEAGRESTLSAEEWTTWWTRARGLGLAEVAVPDINAPEAQRGIDAAMAELRAIRLSRERRADSLREFAFTLRELPIENLNLPVLREAAEEADHALTSAREALREAEGIVAEAARRQVELRSEQQELSILAEMALRHLGDRCPVCEQIYDRDATRRRLNLLIQQPDRVEEEATNTPNVAELARNVEAMERSLSAASASLQVAQREERMRVDGRARVRAGLAALGIELGGEEDLAEKVEKLLVENSRDLESLATVAAEGEVIALTIANVGQVARRAELEDEVQTIQQELAIANEEVAIRLEARELATSMIDGLRDTSSTLVERELRRLEPLLQRIYATADPHPEFRVVRLLSSMSRGRGRVLAEVEDPVGDHRIDAPIAFLSSSQINVLALSVFLALNLGIPTLPLRVAILDDPLQSLDDLNLLGLLDLLKRIRERRQLMISTHDSRLASLLERKLRPVTESQRTIVVEFDGWNREGPLVGQRDIARDARPVRIVAA